MCRGGRYANFSSERPDADRSVIQYVKDRGEPAGDTDEVSRHDQQSRLLVPDAPDSLPPDPEHRITRDHVTTETQSYTARACLCHACVKTSFVCVQIRMLVGMQKSMPHGKRTSLALSHDDRRILNEVRTANGWTVSDATSRAVHTLFALDAQLKGRAKQQKGRVRQVIERIAREVDPALLVAPKPLSKVETDAGMWGVRVDDLLYFEEDDRLLARRDHSGRIEVYEVLDGRLVLRHPMMPPAALN